MLLSCLALALLISPALSTAAEHLMVCGGAMVYQIDPAVEKPVKTWTWQAKDCKELPEVLRGAFATTDDCKPLDEGRKLLVSSSSGGCALLEIPSGKALWWAKVSNAHSIEGLPGGLIAVAASISKEGNKVLLFDSKVAEKALAEIPLHSGHGLVWDDSRKTLWALGYEELLACELGSGDSRTLTVKERHALPDKDGHDLRAVPGSADLILSTDHHVWRFDREKKSFRADPILGDSKLVKCTEPNAAGRLLVVQASEEKWWTDEIHFHNPDTKLQIPGEMIYKARWMEVREVP